MTIIENLSGNSISKKSKSAGYDLFFLKSVWYE